MAEICDGVGTSCPANTFADAGTCGTSGSCDAGVCVEPDAGPVDAGVDASTIDAGVDAFVPPSDAEPPPSPSPVDAAKPPNTANIDNGSAVADATTSDVCGCRTAGSQGDGRSLGALALTALTAALALRRRRRSWVKGPCTTRTRSRLGSEAK